MNKKYIYPGNELSLFEKAVNWKNYFSSKLTSYFGSNILEVGSGIGATSILLNNGKSNQWTLLEPDPQLSEILQQKLDAKILCSNSRLQRQTIFELPTEQVYDTIIYIDVLEHIADDKLEMQRAAELLIKGGYIIVLSPAFNFLYSRFDKAIGHYRRYSKHSLTAAMPDSVTPVKLEYLDTTGYFASLANKLLFKQKYPTEQQIRFWDTWLIPVSKQTDKIFFHSFGKSILGIWRKSK